MRTRFICTAKTIIRVRAAGLIRSSLARVTTALSGVSSAMKAGKELSAMLTRLQEPILLMARLMAAWAKTPLRLIFEKVIFITLGAATLGTKVRARAGI